MASRRLLVIGAWSLSAVMVLGLVALPVSAQETTVKNDSVSDFEQVAIQAGFAANERAAVWLTSPCDGKLVAVQILWRSLFGGTGDTLGESILIQEAGTFPTPGTTLSTLSGPLLTDGFLNEYRFLDQGGTVPLSVPLALDQVFVVSFRFLTATPGLGPSLVTDVDGCQAGKNAIFAIPPSTWFSACSLGVSGDFVMRAVVDCSVVEEEIFSDDFETGDTSLWTVTVP